MRRVALVLAALLVGCGDDDGSPAGPGDHSFKAVVASMLLGTPPGEYAADLDDDGEEDDALGSIARTLATASDLDLQGGIDAAIAAGDTLFLVEVLSHDSSFEDDDHAALVISRAAPQPNPDLDGGGSFTVDATTPSFVVNGAIANHVFRSDEPSGAPAPLALAIAFGGDQIVEVPIIAVYITVTIDPDAHTLVAGKLAGAALADELDGALMPALATQYNAAIAADPTDASVLLILNLFDTGACDGGIADNSVIELCEVETNSLLNTVIAPDVDILDASGNVAPKANGPKDAISLGVGFSGVAASF